jgi:hypothetical protein
VVVNASVSFDVFVPIPRKLSGSLGIPEVCAGSVLRKTTIQVEKWLLNKPLNKLN